MSKLISLLGAFGVTAAIAGPTYVSLQTSSPGVPESGNINVNGFVASSIARVDNSNTNTGKLTPGLLFGPTNSGEGISSARTATSPNSNGLDLYTNSTARLSITNGGNVGIGTKTPSEKLTVQGNLAVSGKVAASNMPAIKMVQGQDLYVQASQSSQTVTVCQLPIYVPAAGYLKISTNMTANLDASQLLYCETFLNQSRVSYFTCATDTVGQTFPVSKSTVVPITAGSHSLSLTAFTYVPTTTYAMSVVEPGIIVEYFPSSL